MRRPLSLLCLLLAGGASADPLIDIPTARKLTFGTYKIEFADSFDGSGTQLGWLDVGIGKSFEATVREEEIDGTRVRPTADLMYSLISALPGESPGIAFGVQDIANNTPDGMRGYLVTTFREPTQTFEGELPLDLTLGVSAGRKVLPFVGLLLPISRKVKFMIEHNGYRPAGGLQYEVSHSLSFRFLLRGPKTLADVMWTSRF